MSLTSNEWIDLLGSFASVVVAFATLYTVLELKAQRRDSHRPEVILVNQMVEAKKGHDLPFGWPINWREPDAAETSQLSRSFYYPIRLHNIGSGPAKNVAITWDYPLDKLIQRINQVCQQSNQDFHLEFEPDKMFVSIRSIGGGKDSDFNRTSNMSSMKEYILPSSVERKPTDISVPLAFILLNSISASLEIGADLLFAVLEQVGQIGLRIEYYDMLDIKYIASFQCRINYHLITRAGFSGSYASTELS